MLHDGLRLRILPAFDDIASAIAKKGITAGQAAVAAFAVGCLSALAIWASAWWTALLLLVLSLLGSEIDAALARASGKAEFHGFLKTVLQSALSGLIPLAFVLADPAANAVSGAGFLLCLFGNAVSLQACSAFTDKTNLQQPPTSAACFHTGFAGSRETYAILVLACIFPGWFPALACLFAALCIYTVFSRVMLAYKNPGETPSA
jgi:phosphatidylglycerophosphate synthase